VDEGLRMLVVDILVANTSNNLSRYRVVNLDVLRVPLAITISVAYGRVCGGQLCILGMMRRILHLYV
jgi:hypothetical protein